MFISPNSLRKKHTHSIFTFDQLLLFKEVGYNGLIFYKQHIQYQSDHLKNHNQTFPTFSSRHYENTVLLDCTPGAGCCRLRVRRDAPPTRLCVRA